MLTVIAASLVFVPASILALHLSRPPEWTAETVTGAAIAVLLFGVIPNVIPAVVLYLMALGKHLAGPADLLRNRQMLFAFLGALISVYAVHWWTFSDTAEFGLLVHAAAVPVAGLAALLIGFGIGSIPGIRTKRP